jgi:hypothetical protein
MSARDYTLTLTGVAQCLKDVLGNTERGGPQDEAFRMLALQPDKANTNDIYVGASSAVTSSLYGIRLDPTDTQPTDILGHFDTGPYKLSDFWVIGTNAEKLHIFGIPF